MKAIKITIVTLSKFYLTGVFYWKIYSGKEFNSY